MTTENENLFEIETDTFDGNNEKLPISLFQEIEADLCDRLMHSNDSEDDQTDGPLEFIQDIVENVKSEFEKGDRKIFFKILTEIFAILRSLRADSTEKIIKILKFSISTVLKTWSEQN